MLPPPPPTPQEEAQREGYFLIDVMRGDRFVFQMRYPMDGCRMVVRDTGFYYYIDDNEIRRFALELRPSLRGVPDLRFLPSKNRIL